jgi:hypothetical protein
MSIERLRKAVQRMVVQSELRSYEIATLGRKNSNNTYTFDVPGRPNFVWVTKADQTVTFALNKGEVPLRARLPVKIRDEGEGFYVIKERYRAGEAPSTTPESPYGTVPHPLGEHTNVVLSSPVADEILGFDGTNWINREAPGGAVDSVNGQTGDVVLDSDDIAEGTTNLYMSAAEATKLAGIADGAEVNVNADWAAVSGDAQILNKPTIPATFDDLTDGTTNKAYTATEKTKLAGIEALADVTDLGNVGSSIHGATAKTTPVDADTMPLIDSAASNVLKKVTWANIKATLKTYLDTLYVALTGDQTIAGNKTLTGNTRLGSSGAASNVVYARKDQNANTAIIVENATNGASAQAAFQAINSAGNNFSFAIYPPARSYGAIAGGDGFMYGTSNVVIMCDNASGVIKFAAGGQNERARIDASGNVGLGVVAPQGICHAHDGTTGWLKTSKVGVAGTAVTLIPNGTGDCLYRLEGRTIVRASDGTVTSGNINANNGGSAILYNAGGHVLTLGVNADGSIYVQRTAGSLTFNVSFDLEWQ